MNTTYELPFEDSHEDAKIDNLMLENRHRIKTIADSQDRGSFASLNRRGKRQ